MVQGERTWIWWGRKLFKYLGGRLILAKGIENIKVLRQKNPQYTDILSWNTETLGK